MPTSHTPLRLPLKAAAALCLLLLARTQCPAQKPQLVVQTGHPTSVEAAAFSPDGRLFASGDTTVKLWDLATGTQLRTLGAESGDAGSMNALVFSPDGKTLAGSHGYGIRFWNVADGSEVRALGAEDLSGLVDPRGGAIDIAYSADGRTLVVSSQAWFGWWDVATGKRLRLLPLREFDVFKTAFGPDLKTAAVAYVRKDAPINDYRDKVSLALLDLETGAELRKLQRPGEGGGLHALSLSPDGKTVGVAGYDGVTVWAASSGARLHIFKAKLNALAFSPDGKTLAGKGSVDGVARIWDLSDGKETPLFGVHSGRAVWSPILFSPDGRWLACASDTTIKIWGLSKGSGFQQLRSRIHPVEALAHVADGKSIVAAGRGRINVWNLDKSGLAQSVPAGDYYLFTASPRGKFVAYNDGVFGSPRVRVWDVARGAELPPLQGTFEGITSLAFSEDEKLLAGGRLEYVSDRREVTVKIWDLATGQEVRTLKTPDSQLSSFSPIAFSPDGKTLAAVGTGRGITVWDIKSGEPLRTLPVKGHSITRLAFSPDGALLAGCAIGREFEASLVLWEVESGELVLRAKISLVNAIAFSHDSEVLAAGSADGSITVWKLWSGSEPLVLKGHTGNVGSLSFNSDGKILASGSQDGTIRHWEVSTGRELASMVTLEGGEWAVVTPDGRFDASPKAMDLMHWTVAEEVIALSQLKERYYEPGLLSKLTGLGREPLRDISEFKDVKLFPAVEYAGPSAGETSLTIKLTNRGGGIGPVQVFVNGKEFVADARPKGFNPNAARAALKVDLKGAPGVHGGANQIRVVARNAEGYLASRDVEMEWQAGGETDQTPPELYAVVAGVSDYEGDRLDLRYAAKDAEDFARALEIGAKNLFGTERTHVTLLRSAAAGGGEAAATLPTKANIRRAFEEVARKARPTDVLVVYLAGHGVSLGRGTDTYLYLTRDARSASGEDLRDADLLRQVAVTSDELTEWIKAVAALKQVMILDTCAAGAAAARLTEKRDLSGDQIRAIERLKDRTGFHVLMGSAADAVSYEASQYGQGLLTYSLLQGMRGAALADDGQVDVQRLFQYAADQVPQLARNVGGIQKPLVAAPRGTSFPVGRLEGPDKARIPLALFRPLVLRPRLLNPAEGDDTLDLIKRLGARLREASYVVARGEAAPLVYVDAEELPGAIRPSGTYAVEGAAVTVRLVLRQDNRTVAQLAPVEGSTDDLPGLVARLAAAVAEALARLPPPAAG